MPYKSRYKPTRPFKYVENQAVTTDRLRVSRFILGVVETNSITMEVTSDYYETWKSEYTAKHVGAHQLGQLAFETGDVMFSYAQDAELSSVEFFVDNWLGCSILNISWEGQYHQSKRRMR